MEQVCNPVVGSERQELTNVDVSEVPPEERDLYLGCIADEFIPPSHRLDFIKTVETCLLTPPQQVVGYPDEFPRGAYLVGMRDGESGQPIGVSLLKLYATKLIAPQLNIDLNLDCNQARLMRFEEMQTRAGIPSDVPAIAECVYSWVRPESRGRGYGKTITTARRQVVLGAFGSLPAAIFGIVRCKEEVYQHGRTLFQHLLAKETAVNGTDDVQRSIITGVPVPLRETLNYLGISEQCVTNGIDPRALATKQIFAEHGLRQVGYTKNLAPMYAGVLS